MATDLAGFNLPDITKVNPTTGGASYDSIMSNISKTGQIPSITKSVMPTIAGLLAPGGQKLSPYEKSIEAKTNANVAQTQTDMMKRGLTGSDIEATAMGSARAEGQNAIAQMYSQTADQLSSMLYQAAVGDINSNKELLLNIAQAMGQELTSQRDLEMFREGLKASLEQANMMSSSQMAAGWMGLGGNAIGAVGTYLASK